VKSWVNLTTLMTVCLAENQTVCLVGGIKKTLRQTINLNLEFKNSIFFFIKSKNHSERGWGACNKRATVRSFYTRHPWVPHSRASQGETYKLIQQWSWVWLKIIKRKYSHLMQSPNDLKLSLYHKACEYGIILQLFTYLTKKLWSPAVLVGMQLKSAVKHIFSIVDRGKQLDCRI